MIPLDQIWISTQCLISLDKKEFVLKVNIFKIIILVSLSAIMVVYTNCGSPFSSPSPLYFESNIYGGSANISYSAFEKTVYPITRANCISCHSTQQPAHASDNLKTAHDAVVANFKVNFKNIPTSRMVKKLRDDNHNCWGDCESNALEMEAAITEWNDLIKDSNTTTPDPVDLNIYTHESKTLAEELATSGNVTKTNVINLMVEPAMLNPPMTKVTNSQEGTYLWVPNQMGTTLANNDANAGKANLNFVVRQNSNQYRIWGLVDAPNTMDNGFYTNITTGNAGIKEWEIPVTSGFEWRQLENNTFNLTAGTHNLEIRQRKDGTKIKQVVITSDNSFSSATAPDLTGVTLTFDLSEQVRVPGVTLKIDLIDYDPYSFKVQNPRIITTSVNIQVKKMRLLVNKAYNPQHSTYNLVDKVVTPADGKLSDYAMLVIKENGLNDKISFSFEELEVEGAGGNIGGDTGVDAASLASFKDTVYPISRTNCISCHTTQNPPHAHEDYVEAHDVVLTQNLVNFTTPANSKLVTKVKARHNCGTQAQCDAIANQYQAAIIEWKRSRP